MGNKKTKRGIRREGKCKENVLKKYCQLNVQGLITTNQPQEKVEIIRDLMNKERPLFLALTETWLHEYKEAEVHIEDYTIYRKDRPLRREIGRRGSTVHRFILANRLKRNSGILKLGSGRVGNLQ